MDYMQEAIQEAYEGIRNKEGGPFGTVIVRDGVIVGRGHNRVLKKQDPTCHGEMEAIRDACRNLGNHDLSGCVLYTTAAPCPMCLGGILWANIDQVYYGCTVEDSDAVGFRDERFFGFLKGEDKTILTMEESSREACLQLFRDYQSMDPERY